MPRRPAPFTKAKLTSAIEAIIAAGMMPRGVKVGPDSFEVLFGKAGEGPEAANGNEWDDVLP